MQLHRNLPDDEAAMITCMELRVQCGRVNSRGGSRGVQQGAVHQGAIVTIVNQIIGFTDRAALRGLVGHFDLDRVFGVVEVNDVNVKDQNGRARDEVSYSGTKKRSGQWSS